jgi:hypothetical protein
VLQQLTLICGSQAHELASPQRSLRCRLIRQELGQGQVQQLVLAVLFLG